MAPTLQLKCGVCNNVTNFSQTDGTKYCPHCQTTVCKVEGNQVQLKNGTEVIQVYGDKDN